MQRIVLTMTALIRLISIFFLFYSVCLHGQDWDLVKEKGQIKVFTRIVEGKRIKELKIETAIQSSLNSIVSILDDVDSHPSWVYKCATSRIVDTASPSEFNYYISVDFPFPARDRDMVIYYKRWQDPITKIVTTVSRSAHDHIAEKPDYIRIVEFESEYTLTPREAGWVDVVYTMSSDPAGVIPAWMINMAIAKGPVLTMGNMVEEIKKEKYQSADVEGVEELY